MDQKSETANARKTDQKNITYLQETGTEILIRTYLMQNDIMQCGKCVRDFLRNLMLFIVGKDESHAYSDYENNTFH